MERIKNSIRTGLFVSMVVLSGAFVSVPAYAATDPNSEVCKGVTAVGGECDTKSSGQLTALIKNVINVLLFISGLIAVIMIILGGIRYITSNGDQADVKAAKDTILYAVVGLVVALLAFAIVNFVVFAIK